MMPPRYTRKSRGFTLIEALVALVIFSMAAIGIYGWINTNLISLNRIAEVAATEQVINASIERLKLVDMSTETSGAFNVNDYLVNWQAELIEPWANGLTSTGAIGLYDFGLFKVTLSLSKNAHSFSSYEYRRTVYKQVRQMKLEGDD